MLEHRYRAFLCYSHRDSDWADWLHGALESYPVPPRLVGIATNAGVIPARIAPVFRDRDELPSAANLSEKVSDAIAQSANLIVICSPHAAQSRWVNEEVRAFQRLGRSDRIFCLIVDGEPGASAWAGREHDECLPAALTKRLDAEGRETGETLEPIAADARPGKDGKSNARTKLVAGLLGVDLDDLRHRERRRRHLRTTAAFALGFVVVCLTTALAINAVIARRDAERRQKQAEDLIGFMLGDLDDKLRQVNRLDILESVADKSVKYFASTPIADANDATLAQNTRALQKIGQVRYEQGRMTEAENAFNAARTTAEELVRRGPVNAVYAVLDADTLNWLGQVAWARGDLEIALQRFRAALSKLDALSTEQQDGADALALVGSVRTNIGRVLEANGALDDARAEYAVVLATYKRLNARQHDSLQWKSEVGYAHNNLGQIAWKEGRLDEAIREYASDLLIKTNLASLEPASNERREDLLISKAILGKSLAAVGESALAERYIGAAVTESKRLMELDATVASWQEDAGYYALMLSAVQRARGDLAGANRLGEIAGRQLRALVAQDAENAQFARDLVESEMEASRRLLEARRTADAAALLAAAGKRFRDTLKDDAEDRRSLQLLARIDVIDGDVAQAQGDPVAARTAWLAAETRTRKLITASRDPTLLDVRANALIRLDDRDAASALLGQLAAMGYRDADLVVAAKSHGFQFEPDADATLRIAAAIGTLDESSGNAASEVSATR